tara:strand:+ start:181 stop:300 length:120 start_codon:yes stop_codon:yes gene_type:complete
MIKKTILIILLSVLVLSCGKKGDPKYKESKNINFLYKII